MENSEIPLVSVVIPTHGRPEFLQRAVDSCRGIAPGCVEVIVVPNGGTPCTVRPFVDRGFELRIIESPHANANIARNIGLAAARGRLVRFLDDDDYLLTPGAFQQHLLACSAISDVCSGAVQIVDSNDRIFRTIAPAGLDLVTAVLAPHYSTLTTAHVYRRAFLQGLLWNPLRMHLQDVEWMHGIVRRSDVKWVTLGEPVGVWQHHLGMRISTGILKRNPDLALKELEAIVSTTTDHLANQGRLNYGRSQASAESLWHCAHHGFPFDPMHWCKTGARAVRLDPMSRPRVALYQRKPWSYLSPLVLEWCFYPYRRFTALWTNRT